MKSIAMGGILGRSSGFPGLVSHEATVRGLLFDDEAVCAGARFDGNWRFMPQGVAKAWLGVQSWDITASVNGEDASSVVPISVGQRLDTHNGSSSVTGTAWAQYQVHRGFIDGVPVPTMKYFWSKDVGDPEGDYFYLDQLSVILVPNRLAWFDHTNGGEQWTVVLDVKAVRVIQVGSGNDEETAAGGRVAQGTLNDLGGWIGSGDFPASIPTSPGEATATFLGEDITIEPKETITEPSGGDTSLTWSLSMTPNAYFTDWT